jgi:hypothetical protein
MCRFFAVLINVLAVIYVIKVSEIVVFGECK